jgi:nucleoside-diphosphate-sugar epimerase
VADPRHVLVTGGAGFVGATLVRRLAGSGHQVRVPDNIRRTWQWSATPYSAPSRAVTSGPAGRLARPDGGLW